MSGEIAEIPDPTEGLSEMEARFVAEYIAGGGADATRAALRAGYAAKSAHVSAHHLLRRDRVLTAIKREAERRLQAGVALGAAVLVELATGAKSETVRRQAAKDLLDHGGLPAITRSEHVVTVRDNRTDAQLRAHVERLSRELGLAAVTIEGTATEAPAPAAALPAPVAIDVDADEGGYVPEHVEHVEPDDPLAALRGLAGEAPDLFE